MKIINAIIQKTIAIILIIVMTSTYLNLLGVATITYAIDMLATNNDNVEFRAYFVSQDGGETTEINKNINDKDLSLNIEIAVKNEGYFEGEIYLENPNFKLREDFTNQYVKRVENNVIYLNSINTEEVAKIEVGIDFFEENSIDLSSLNSPTIINLTGIYYNSKNNEKISCEREIKVNWTSPENATAELLTKVLTNTIYRNEESSKRIVQILVADRLSDNSYPIKNTEIVANIPEGAIIKEIHKRTTNATNGNKQFTEQNYRIENNKVIINIDNPEIEGKISWNKNTRDILVLTYEMPETLNIDDVKINVQGKIDTYDNKNFIAQEQEVQLIQEIEGSATITKRESETSIYKGKLYSGEEREYTSFTTVFIDNAEMVGDLIITEDESKYVTESGLDLANIDYKNIKLNKQNIEYLLGNNWEIKITDQNGKEIFLTNSILSQESEYARLDENGIITCNFDEGTKRLKIETSKIYNNGILEIQETKQIRENNYGREKIKEIQRIKNTSEINYQSQNVFNAESEIELKETETKASLEISKTSLIDSNTNENIEIIAKLGANGENLNLYKNPKIDIIFPKEVSKVSVIQAKLLYKNGLEVRNKKIYRKEDGRIGLYIEFDGQQLMYDTNGGTEVHLYLNIDLNKLDQNKTDLIEMNYTNEIDETVSTQTKEVMMYANSKLIQPHFLKATISEGFEADITAIKGFSELQEGDEVYEGETIKYTITLNNNSGTDYNNIQVNATQTNGKVWDLVKVQLYNAMGEEVEPEDMYRLTDKDSINFEKINILKNGESIKLEYEATPDKLENETTKTTYGTISIVSEGGEINKTIKTPESTIKKAELELQIIEANTRQYKWKDDDAISSNINITNLTENEIQNAELKIVTSRNLGYDAYSENTKFLGLYKWKDIISIKNIEKNEQGQSILTLQISKIEPKETIQILNMPCVTNFNYENDFEYVKMLAYLVTAENNRYYSNTMNRAVYNAKENIELIQNVYNDGKQINENGKIDSSKDVQFVITIKNEEDKKIPIALCDTFPPLGVDIKEVKLEADGETKDITEDVTKSVLYTLIDLLPKKTITIRINTKINTGVMSSNVFENSVKVDIQGNNQKFYSTFKLNTDKKIDLNDDNGNNEPTEEPNKEQEETPNGNPSQTPEETPIQIPNTISEDTSKKGTDGNNDNSTITENNLTPSQNFDLKLEKYVSKIAISNEDGNKTYNFNDSELAKVEIRSKYLVGTKAIIEYKIKVTNVGDIAGYAKQIVDYKPTDLKFESKLNKNWYLSDGKIYTKALSKTKIEPGETKELILILTKTLTATNTGLINNRAEITEDFNDLRVKDINSIPGNKNSEENDLGQANVILTISTGEKIQNIITNLFIIVLTGIMVYCIKNIISEFRRKENV
ncbi:MAG: hypothetical protein IJK18_02815 [Clostridia bacterium]|nr:hypothetical protein [Clostridia bacterium]